MIKYSYYIKISDILIHIKIPFKIIVQKEVNEFICNKEYNDVLIEFVEIDKSINISGKLVYKDVIKIYETDQGFIHELYSAPGYPFTEALHSSQE